MVINAKQSTRCRRVNQAVHADIPEANKIGVSTPYDFQAHNLTAYGGLLPVATMLEKLGFQQLIEENLTIKRQTRAMPVFRFILGMILACYVGFSRLHHLRFLKREPMLTGILHVAELPPQCTFWRFLASLHLGIARQLLSVQKRMRERVWAAANVGLDTLTIDTDTTVHTLFGNQMGARKGYNPKNKGKKSYQPILSFIAETREYAAGALRNGDRPDGREIAAHLEAVAASLPPVVKRVYARADSGFYCREAIDAYEKKGWHYIVVARKTARLIEQLQAVDWKPSPKTDADQQCEFFYQPEGWSKAHRFLALRYARTEEDEKPQQYQLFDTPQYIYRVFVTDLDNPIDLAVWFYNQRAGAENLIKEANNDAGLTAHPSNRWMMNANWFQIAMLAYNLNCWLQLFQRDDNATVETMKHTTLATARLRFLFLAARIWRHAGRVGVSYSDHYQEKHLFQRLMERLRSVARGPDGFAPVLATPLRA
ncbi:MAG TPA: IS1380 family transposase [Acidobacteriaceae bacterium]|nr:IS1380 family transposase [Acidobacteriaceae bacterium]